MYYENASKDHLPANTIGNIITLYKNTAIAAADLTEYVPISSAMKPIFISPMSAISDLNALNIIYLVNMHNFT